MSQNSVLSLGCYFMSKTGKYLIIFLNIFSTFYKK